jgi:glutamate/tyrosine decarboxylase-like PLP-dependent enzyme
MTVFDDEATARREALDILAAGFAHLPEFDPPVLDAESRRVLVELAEVLQDNYPYFHPLYAGQMLKPPHPLAREAYQLAMRINPNNHALDGGRATSGLEKTVVADLVAMVGWPSHLGHLTGGGTMANLEALWVAGSLHPDRGVMGSAQAHYTHQRISRVLGIDYHSVAVDRSGRMDLTAAERILARGDVGTVVATMGTTGLGSVDPLAGLLELAARYDARVHADAAYGGYFTLVDNLGPDTRAAFDALEEVDSLVVDPHKHGLQPYGCGCVLFRDPSVGRLYVHDSPYTYFTADELHLGEISLECSRPGAAAAALWATHQRLPVVPGGEFATGLAAGRTAACELYRRLETDGRFLTLAPPDLDIVVFAPAANLTSSGISAASSRMFEAAARGGLDLALMRLDADLLQAHWPGSVKFDRAEVTCLRTCLMKPEHLSWLDEIWSRLVDGLGAVS